MSQATATDTPPLTATRVAPTSLIGPWAWLRANLFNSWWSTAVTLVLGYVILRFTVGFIDWALVNAVWSVPYTPQGVANTAVCQNVKGEGACWAIIADKYRLILFGRFPYTEQWRPALVVALFVGLYIASACRGFWRRGTQSPTVRFVAIGAAAVLIAAWLLSGILAVAFQSAGAGRPDTMLSGLDWIGSIGFYVLTAALALLWPGLGIWVITLYVIFLLMAGGVLGLSAVPVDYWGGLPITLILATFGIAFAFPLAILVALGRRSTGLPAVRLLCVLYVELIRGVPLISVLFMASVMFPLFMPPGVNVDKLLRAQIAIILFAAAYLAEVVRGGLQAVPKGQGEAADALGLTYWQKTALITLPQALRLVIPPLVNTFIGFFKDTSLVLIIGLFDLLTMGKVALSDPPWQSFSTEVYLTLAVIYIAFCFAMSSYSRRLERDLNDSRRR
jgi:general L-amino acid transport system permease protein